MATVTETFRLLGAAGQIINESTRTARMKVDEDDPEPVNLPPGEMVDVINGDMILEVDIEEP